MQLGVDIEAKAEEATLLLLQYCMLRAGRGDPAAGAARREQRSERMFMECSWSVHGVRMVRRAACEEQVGATGPS